MNSVCKFLFSDLLGIITTHTLSHKSVREVIILPISLISPLIEISATWGPRQGQSLIRLHFN